MFSDTPDIVEVRDYFGHDLWATEACGCEILEAARGHAVCAFDIGPRHRNAMANVMGGAIFTLADFALAIASNIAEEPTVSVTNTIEFIAGTRGRRLVATCDADRSGRSLGFYTTVVTDDTGVEIARMTATCFRRPARS